MADIKSPTVRYKAIADAIREKNGTTELMHPADMPQAILDIVSGGGGVTYTNIVYNEDDTITLTDKDGVEHTMECEYTDGKLTSVKYDGKAVELTYDGDVLVKVGKAAVDVASAQTSSIEPLDHTVKFMVEGEPYEVVSVKDDNSVNAPATPPAKEGYVFHCWQTSGENVEFPLTPTNDMILTPTYEESYANRLYEHFGVNETEYPIVFIHYQSTALKLIFATSVTEQTSSCSVNAPAMMTQKINTPIDIGEITTENVVNACITKLNPVEYVTDTLGGGFSTGNLTRYFWLNTHLNTSYSNVNLMYLE